MSLNSSVAINEDPPSEKSKGFLCRPYNSHGVSHHHLHFGRDSKIAEEWESCVVHKMEVSRSALNGRCHPGVAGGGLSLRGTSYVTG